MLSLFLPSNLVIKVIIAHYLPNVILMLLIPINNNSINKNKITNYSSIIPKAISKSINTLITVLGTIVFFNLLILVIPNKINFLGGFLEITNGLNILKNMKLAFNVKAYISVIFLSFGGLSIIMQIKSILNETNITINNFLKSRIYHIILSILILSLTGV